MKKKLSMIGILAMGALLVACGSKEAKEENKTADAGGNTYTIGINQLMEHKALDDARQGFVDGLEELGVSAEIVEKNAQGEIANSTAIAQKFVSDKVDLMFAIATPSAQATARASKDIPILFTAVTDAEGAKLVETNDKPGGNVTGTIDAADVKSQLEMFKKLDDSIETIGIIYNLSEQNSVVQVETVESLVGEVGLKLETVGIDSINDMSTGIQSLIKKVDAVYIISDNMIAKSVDLIAKELIANKMISISAEESQVAGGILMTNGLKYYDLGKITARMAKEILVDGKNPAEMPVEMAVDKTVVVNKATMEALGLDENNELFADVEYTE